MCQVFLLSSAKTSGERAKMLTNPSARFSLAWRLQKGEPVPLWEVFSFLSGLYFRGKVTYAREFARPPGNIPGALVITSNRGLLPIDQPVSLDDLRALSEVPIEANEPRYTQPLQAHGKLLAKAIARRCPVVFLGSISTDRYVEPLLACFGERLLFPPAFLGRGDMSRGGLLLRAAADKQELEYAPLAGAARHGQRPAKLPARSWGFRITEGKTPVK
jgi:hypothetical protein